MRYNYPAMNANGRLSRWTRELFFGRALTKQDLLRERRRVCASAGVSPESVSNFWVGIEDLKDETRQESHGSETAGVGIHPSDKPADARHLP